MLTFEPFASVICTVLTCPLAAVSQRSAVTAEPYPSFVASAEPVYVMGSPQERAHGQPVVGAAPAS